MGTAGEGVAKHDSTQQTKKCWVTLDFTKDKPECSIELNSQCEELKILGKRVRPEFPAAEGCGDFQVNPEPWNNSLGPLL